MSRGRRSANEQLVGRALAAFPDLDRIRELLDVDPGGELLNAIAANAPALQAPGARAVLGTPTGDLLRQQADVLGAAALSGLIALQRDGEKAQLDDDEADGLEAVVSLLGRPALIVENGHFRAPRPPWEVLERHRATIESQLRSVGRIEVDGYPENDCIGSAFLVSEDIVMTNRHVAKKVLALGGPPWHFEPTMTVRVDFNEEFDAGDPREFAVTEPVAISEDFDIALLRVARQGTGGQALPPPLRLADAMSATKNGQVYVLGYPFYNPEPGTDPEALHRIFSDVYGIKRVQPGAITGFAPETHEFVHDCSTLGGNSGSCVVDLQTGDVIGLHRRGRYLEGNFAIVLSQAKDDPAIKAAGLQFHKTKE